MKVVFQNGRAVAMYAEHAFDWKKNEKGEYVCMNCGKSLVFNKRLRTYCSEACRKEYLKKVYWSWSRVKKTVFERDNWTCQDCGCHVQDTEVYTGSQGLSRLRDDLPECDHIVPLFLGGKDWHEDLPELSNFQTLCRKCHKKKTARDRGKHGKLDAEIRMGLQQKLTD